ncbi:hypothetical protein [Anaplasma bovis]|uniref:hypothetical protein n=1 Tax=Anaplasma bovis TaxID=186733 RepID=UPI002FEE7208
MSGAVHKVCDILIGNVHVALSVLLHALISVVLVVQVRPVGHAQLQYKRVMSAPSVHGESVQPITVETEGGSSQQLPEKVVQSRRLLRPPHSIRHAVDKLNYSPKKSSLLRERLDSIFSKPTVAGTTGEQQTNSKDLPVKYERSSLTKKELNLLTSRLSSCWSVFSDAHASKAVKVTLALDMHGRISALMVRDMHIYNSDPVFRAVADSALRAVRKCSPFKELQNVDYEAWKEIELTFDPTTS